MGGPHSNVDNLFRSFIRQMTSLCAVRAAIKASILETMPHIYIQMQVIKSIAREGGTIRISHSELNKNHNTKNALPVTKV